MANEDEAEMVEAYYEVFPHATDWVFSDDPKADEGNITVTKAGLRRILNLAAKGFGPALYCRMVACDAKRETLSDIRETYLQNIDELTELTNQLSRVFCEGKLIVSGLFVDDTGKPIMNPCADED